MNVSLRQLPPERRASATSGGRKRLAALVPLAIAVALAGCDEKLVTTETCPDLCPEQQISVQQVELQPVDFDTTVAGFPIRGQEARVLVAGGDTVADVRGIFRFDDLPTSYQTAAGETASITQVLEPTLRVLQSRAESRIPASGATLEVYDVGAAGTDTSVAELLPQFTSARRLGTLTVAARPAGDTVTVDTLRIPLDPAFVLARITAADRIRLGVRVVASEGARLSLGHGAQVFFRATPDTLVQELAVSIASDTPEADPLVQLDLASFPLIVRGTTAPAGPLLTVGGMPARRSMLRFAIPENILDSATIVRATLVLNQYPVRGFAAGDSVVIRPLPVTASASVTDLIRQFELAENPTSNGTEVRLVPRLTLAPGDSGRKEFSMANLVSLWSARRASTLRPLLVFAVDLEGATPLQAAFFSAEAPAALRPTLRLSYVRRVNFDLP